MTTLTKLNESFKRLENNLLKPRSKKKKKLVERFETQHGTLTGLVQRKQELQHLINNKNK